MRSLGWVLTQHDRRLRKERSSGRRQAPREDRGKTQGEDATCKPRRGASGGTTSVVQATQSVVLNYNGPTNKYNTPRPQNPSCPLVVPPSPQHPQRTTALLSVLDFFPSMPLCCVCQ